MMPTMYLMKVQIVRYLSGVLKNINHVNFLGVENFLSTFPNQNLDVGFSMLEEKLIIYG